MDVLSVLLVQSLSHRPKNSERSSETGSESALERSELRTAAIKKNISPWGGYMRSNCIKTSVTGSLNETISLVERALQREGFGVLSRIDLHEKFQKALDKTIPPTVILGACAPALAYEALKLNADFALFLPCNVVIRQHSENQYSVEITRPSVQMSLIADPKLSALAGEADLKLETVAGLINSSCSQAKGQNQKDSQLEKDVEIECWDRDLRWGLTAPSDEPGARASS